MFNIGQILQTKMASQRKVKKVIFSDGFDALILEDRFCQTMC
jgi:hypothetical protein